MHFLSLWGALSWGSHCFWIPYNNYGISSAKSGSLADFEAKCRVVWEVFCKYSHSNGTLDQETENLGLVLSLDLKNETHGQSRPDWFLQIGVSLNPSISPVSQRAETTFEDRRHNSRTAQGAWKMLVASFSVWKLMRGCLKAPRIWGCHRY